MSHTDTSLEVSRKILARREEVFEAWTRPEKMDWYSPEDMRLTAANADVRVGGMFRATMEGKDGESHTCYGRYEQIAPNHKLVFTHQWEGARPVQTRVSVQFEDQDGGTLVTLSQSGFVDPQEAKGHEEGWASTLRNLEKQLTSKHAALRADAR